MSIESRIQKALRPVWNRMRLQVSRGVVERVNDALKCQGLQVTLLSDEPQDDVERFQEYGFTSTPFEGAEVVFLSVGANRAAGIVACVTDRRYRPKSLNAGDAGLFTDKGMRVYLDRDSDVVRIGSKTAAEFLLLGTLFRTKQIVLHAALKAWADALAVGFTAVATGFTAVGTGLTGVGVFATAMAGDPLAVALIPVSAAAAGTLAPLMPIAATACGAAATAAGVASTACTTASTAITTFESSGGVSDYKSTKAATVA